QLDQTFGRMAVPREEGGADTGADLDRPPVDIIGATDPLDQLSGEMPGLTRALQRNLQDRELVATQTGDDIRPAQTARYSVRNHLEHDVAGRMAERVVDLLEAVEVDIVDGENLVRP